VRFSRLASRPLTKTKLRVGLSRPEHRSVNKRGHQRLKDEAKELCHLQLHQRKRTDSSYPKEDRVAVSARNQLKGEVTEIILGTVMAHITIQVGENIIESVITRRSADELDLQKGDKVTAVIKATEVLVAKP
jgi:molybdopterin-binding protein